MSPTLFYEGPYRFFFFSREEKRMHVQVMTSDGEAKFWLEPDISLAQNHGLSKAEITNISPYGVWLIVNDKEYYLPYSEFPWFKDAKLSDIFNLELHNTTHLYWPALDIDLDIEILENFEKYPLKYY